MVLPDVRLLERRVWRDAPFHSHLRNKQKMQLGWIPPGTCESPRSRAVMNQSNRAALFHLSCLVAEQEAGGAPLVPRSLNPSVTSGQRGNWLIVDSGESKTAHRVVKTGQSDGCPTTNAYRLRSGGGFFRWLVALLFRCVHPKKGEEIS